MKQEFIWTNKKCNGCKQTFHIRTPKGVHNNFTCYNCSIKPSDAVRQKYLIKEW